MTDVFERFVTWLGNKGLTTFWTPDSCMVLCHAGSDVEHPLVSRCWRHSECGAGFYMFLNIYRARYHRSSWYLNLYKFRILDFVESCKYDFNDCGSFISDGSRYVMFNAGESSFTVVNGGQTCFKSQSVVDEYLERVSVYKLVLPEFPVVCTFEHQVIINIEGVK